jgi:hypothetical protein
MRPSGKTSIGTLLLLAGLVIGGFLFIRIVPAYLDNLDVKEGLQIALTAGKVRGADDDRIRKSVLEKSERVGTHKADDGYGNVVDQVGLGLKPENIFIERTGNRVFIQANYDRVIELRPLSRTITLSFSPSVDAEMNP